jgi:uncharacterized protein (TIGR03437 family)
MSKLGNCIGLRVRCLLVLVGLINGAAAANYYWTGRALAQAAVSQTTSPAWILTGSFNTPRLGHTATQLPDGRVLITGGFNCAAEILASTEIYDPAAGTWSYAADLPSTLYEHTATLLPNGKVLVAGGNYGADQSTNAASLYDPATGKWSPTGGLNSYRANHTATLLANGKVLVVGVAGTAEIYDPADERWHATGSLSVTKYGYHATLLPDGKVLFVGGTGNSSSNSDSAELYDPDTGTWRVTGSLNTIRDPYTATLMPDGKVLMTGSGTLGGVNRPFAEIYDPASETWSSTIAPSNWGTPILLPNGKVLAVSQNSAELYDPATGRWSPTTGPNTLISNLTMAFLLPDGRFLFPNGLLANGISRCAPESARPVLLNLGSDQTGMVANVSAASFGQMGLAGETIAAGFGSGLATIVSLANTFPLPTQLSGTSVRIIDSAGQERLAPLFFVSPSQVNYLIPEGTAAGAATVTITSGDGMVSTGRAVIRAVAPSLFTANNTGDGLAAALALRVKADGAQSYEPISQLDEDLNRFVARPIDLGPEGERVYLVLYGTGLRHRRSLSSVIAAIGGEYAEVTFAGAHPQFLGLDQVNVLVPRSLIGRGEVEVLLTIEALMANPVRLKIK